MAKRSAGLLMFRRARGGPEVLLVHPGGPFWAKKDDGAWSIPKGLYQDDEDPLVAAKREFEEETGQRPAGVFIALGVFKQPGGKQVSAWAFEGEFDLASFKSNIFELEWPPKSGRLAEFPEADRAAWFPIEDALRKVTKGQVAILSSLTDRLGRSEDGLA
ncbi:NUDIX hydrolase [Bradyrhizobium macuxiense]|uniref:NUDIX hydrolase n=1 Tax=Bradyrhizobium macuxiense TaxID=1755647 RepID=A0A109K5A0_9BRAD|nr:NUDIX domain-containing protein [Bradyrhizobium macuxiense]KWV60916.1 NUDIX hydrolase [Bradyrhizobium macuxiense]